MEGLLAFPQNCAAYGKRVLMFRFSLIGPTLKNIFYLNSYLEVEGESQANCCICEERARLPLKASCGHLYCYYCHSVTFKEGDPCRSCGTQVSKWSKMF